MTNYVCTELAPPQNGYIACKTWTPITNYSWVDVLAITPKEMVMIGGSIVSTLGVILVFVLIAKASKQL